MNLLFTPCFIMFDFIDPDVFEDIVAEHFSVLEGNYVADQCRDLYTALKATFENAIEARFIILEKETCKPLNVNAILKTRDAAEEFLKIAGDDKYEIGFLLIDR